MSKIVFKFGKGKTYHLDGIYEVDSVLHGAFDKVENPDIPDNKDTEMSDYVKFKNNVTITIEIKG